MGAARVVLGYADYAVLPDDGKRYEIHDGELSVTLSPGTRHQRIIGRLLVAIYTHVEQRGIGEAFVAPYDVILSDTSVVQPDIVYVAAETAGSVSDRGIEGPPTLAIEILSPSTIQIDRHTKLQLYARHGVQYSWIVDPDARSVEAYALREGAYVLAARAGGDETLRAEPFPDLPLPLAALWA